MSIPSICDMGILWVWCVTVLDGDASSDTKCGVCVCANSGHSMRSLSRVIIPSVPFYIGAAVKIFTFVFEKNQFIAFSWKTLGWADLLQHTFLFYNCRQCRKTFHQKRSTSSHYSKSSSEPRHRRKNQHKTERFQNYTKSLSPPSFARSAQGTTPDK